MKNVVILGAGFGGINAAIQISRKLKDFVQVILVDINNYHLFKPMLHEVATGSVDSAHIIQPISHITRKKPIIFIRGMAQRIDVINKNVYICENCSVCLHKSDCSLQDFDLSSSEIMWNKKIIIDYDYLIFALGGSPDYYGIEGAKNYAFPFNSMDNAEKIREHVLSAFAMAERIIDREKRKAMLTFAIVGAGPTGLELANDLHDWIYGALLTEFKQVGKHEITLYLIEADNDILPLSPEKIRNTVRKRMKDKQIIFLMDSPVIRVGKGLLTTTKTSVKTYTTIWTAGIRGNDLPGNSGIPVDKSGRLVVDECLAVPDLGNLFAIGDCASYTSHGSVRALPQTGQVAVQEAHFLMKNIYASMTGKPSGPFEYKGLGTAFSLGRRQGIANILDFLRLGGYIGWVVWKLTYLKHLIGLRLSFRSILEWFFDITYDREASRHKF